MNSIQYEEFCRYFLSVQLNIDVAHIQSVHIPNPTRIGLMEYKHQIDLYWEDGNELVSYINIANAKWRTNSKIEQGEVLLLNQVKLKVGAHKAVMLTNVGFTKGAEAVAQNDGIALHLVQPAFDYSLLPTHDRDAIQRQIQEIASSSHTPIWNHQTYYKSFENFTAILPEEIQQKLEEESDGDRFYIPELWRHLEYLKYVKHLIEIGAYGANEEVSIYEQEIQRTRALIETKLSEIEEARGT